jgi:hypothetical protein
VLSSSFLNTYNDLSIVLSNINTSYSSPDTGYNAEESGWNRGYGVAQKIELDGTRSSLYPIECPKSGPTATASQKAETSDSRNSYKLDGLRPPQNFTRPTTSADQKLASFDLAERLALGGPPVGSGGTAHRDDQ